MARMHKTILERKYSLTVEAAKELVFLPMLANSWEKCKKKVVYPVDVQRKLDGVRCMAFWHGDEVKLLSRGGMEYNVAPTTSYSPSMKLFTFKSLRER